MTDKKKRAVGWMYRTEGQPRYIKVTILGSELNRGFADSEDGAREAAEWVSHRLERDDWTLVDMAFLGYRIVVPVEEETVHWRRPLPAGMKVRIMACNDGQPAWMLYQEGVIQDSPEGSEPLVQVGSAPAMWFKRADIEVIHEAGYVQVSPKPEEE